MKLVITLAALLRAVLPSCGAHEVDPGRMIAVLIAAEDGHWGDPGGAGHMMYPTWGDYSRQSYQLASHEKYALPIYRIHIAKLIRQIRVAGVAVTPENIGIAWRRGFKRAMELNWQDEYGRRCQNLWNDASFGH